MSSSDSSYVRAATASARLASFSSPNRRATIACWCRTDPVHEPDGTRITSQPSKTSTYRRTSGSASRRYPVFVCICPQQVCACGNVTSCPSRSSSRTVACPTPGKTLSARHVTNSAIRTVPSPPVRGDTHGRAAGTAGLGPVQGPEHAVAAVGHLPDAQRAAHESDLGVPAFQQVRHCQFAAEHVILTHLHIF